MPVGRRQVDCRVQVEAPVAPAPDLGAGPLEHPGGDRPDQPGALGGRQEVAGQEQARLGVVPADERLGAHDARRPEIDDGLVVELELVAPLGMPQLRGDRQLASRVALWRLVQAVAVAPAVLGGVHGDVGMLEQRLGRVAIGRKQARADAGRHVQVGAGDRKRLRERRSQLGGDRLGRRARRALIDGTLHEHEELVAALARDDVAGPARFAQPLRNHHQQLVSDRVTEAVVHELEVVQVDEEHRAAAAAALRICDRDGQVLLEQGPVGQVGERIVERQMGKPLLARAAHGHVEEHAVHVPHDPVAVVHALAVALHPAGRAVRVDQAVLDRIRLAARKRISEQCRDGGKVFGVDDAVVTAPAGDEELLRREAGDRLDRR